MIPRVKYVEVHQKSVMVFAEFKNSFEIDTVTKTLREVGNLTDEHYFYGDDKFGRRYPKYGHFYFLVDNDRVKEFRDTIRKIAQEEGIRIKED